MRQKKLAIKEHIRFCADEGETQELFHIQAQTWLDTGGSRYDVVDAQDGKIGLLHHVFGKSLLRSTWNVLDAADEEVAVAQERSQAMAILRRAIDFVPDVGGLIPIPYNFDILAGEQVIGRMDRKFQLRDRYVLDLSGRSRQDARPPPRDRPRDRARHAPEPLRVSRSTAGPGRFSVRRRSIRLREAEARLDRREADHRDGVVLGRRPGCRAGRESGQSSSVCRISGLSCSISFGDSSPSRLHLDLVDHRVEDVLARAEAGAGEHGDDHPLLVLARLVAEPDRRRLAVASSWASTIGE